MIGLLGLSSRAMLYFKKILNKPEKEIVNGDFKEVEIRGIEERGLIE